MSDSPMPPSPHNPGPETMPRPPASVRWAVGLIWAGAALSAAYGILIATVMHSSLRATSLTTTERRVIMAAAVIQWLIHAGLWAWMAWKTQAGRNWARTLSVVFFCLLCVDFIIVMAGRRSRLDVTIVVVEMIVGLSALILLYQRESSAFFTAAGASSWARHRGRHATKRATNPDSAGPPSRVTRPGIPEPWEL